jgi:hypothetical protein
MEDLVLTLVELQQVKKSLAEIKTKLDKLFKKNPLSATWLDADQTCELLRISKRTLQKHRDLRVLSFSKIRGKMYFKASDIEDLLEDNYYKAHRSRRSSRSIYN